MTTCVMGLGNAEAAFVRFGIIGGCSSLAKIAALIVTQSGSRFRLYPMQAFWASPSHYNSQKGINMTYNDKTFEDLHVLEIANNPWGNLGRGIKIVDAYADLAEQYNIKAAIKLQLRDLNTFIHEDFKSVGEGSKVADLKGTKRYIQKTQRTEFSKEDLFQLVQHIRGRNLTAMATVFDEASIQTSLDLDLPALKIASADVSDLNLLEAAAETGLPIAISTGGSSLECVDAAMDLLASQGTQVALNHCVSRYPSEAFELNLNQLDVLKERYPEVTLGFSSHEYQDPTASTLMSYAKGARTWERHIDIPYPAGHEQSRVSPYCLIPAQAELWFKAFHLAKEMCGSVQNGWRDISEEEIQYLHALRRGVYYRRNITPGEVIKHCDVYFAVPCQEGQHLASGAFISGQYVASKFCKADAPMVATEIEASSSIVSNKDLPVGNIAFSAPMRKATSTQR